ncbi:hypothetical protein ACJZ2D_016057 [Fusarium nematophilum]
MRKIDALHRLAHSLPGGPRSHAEKVQVCPRYPRDGAGDGPRVPGRCRVLSQYSAHPCVPGPEDTVADSLSTTQRTFDACVEHSLPLETVVQELNRSRAPDDKVRPQAMFVYHDPGRGDVVEASSAKGFLRSAEQLQLASVGSRFDLVVHYCSRLGSDAAHLKFEYRRSLLSREFVATIARSIDAALELMAEATSLCRRLQTVGSVVGTRVLIFLSKSVKLVVAELAVLMGGGTFVVLDPRHKRAINQDKLDTYRPGMIIVDSTTSSLLPSPPSASGIYRVNLSETAVMSCTREEASGPARDDDAYLCFTSASTANAKCFSISHEASAASIMSHIDTFQLNPADRVAKVSSISFDISVLETFAAWAAGATLCIASEDDMLTDLGHILARLEATCVFATPTLLSMIEGGPSTVPFLRLVAAGGEPTPPKLFAQWVGSVDLRDAYGPAEVAMNTHTRRFSPHDPISRVGQRIGRSLPSVRSHVLDCNGYLAFPGCVGYLHIGAREPGRLGHLSRGYVSPVSANAHLAFYTVDGELNFLGRADDQVKVNGVRMNLGDVERALQGDHGQQVMAELGLDASTGDQFVVVMLHVQNPQPRAERGLCCSWLHPPSSDVVQQLLQLRERAATYLIDAMRPRFWIPVSSPFPRSENAKVDRRAVKSWIAEFLSLTDSHIRNQYSALSLGQPHAEGGTSTQRLRETNLGRTLIERWAAVLGVRLRTGGTSSVAEDAYNGLEPGLAKSVIIPIERYPLLLSRSIRPALFSPPDMVEGSVSQRAIQQIDTGWERGFKLGDVMFRLIVVENKDRCHKLILSCHHASCDGWSLNIILRDLAQASSGRPLVPSRPFSAAVAHLRDRSQSVARAYWQSYLEDYSHHSLAWDERHASVNLQMRAVTQTLGSISSHVLADSARRHGVTPAVFLQAALAVLLSNITRKDDVAFGQVVSGRHLPVDGVSISSSEVSSWLRAVYQSSIESLEHHYILLEDIRRYTGGSELLETVFVFENHANRLDSSIFGSLELKSIDGQEFSNVPLTVVAEFVESGLMVTFKFNEAVLPSWRVESMIRAYGSTVADMLTGAAVSELGRSCLDEVVHVKEGFRLLDQHLENLGSHTLVSLFNTAMRAFPDEVAIEEESCSVNFSELSRSSGAVCDYLVEAGIRAGQIVPILCDVSIDMVVAMLGVMKAGAAYCPIDVDSPDLRIRQTVIQVAAKVMIGDRVNGGQTIRGTPGRGNPKACVLSHGAVANAVLQTSSTTQLTQGSRVLLFASYIFDASVIDMFGCLATGGTPCISTPTKLRSNLAQVVNERLIDHAHLTPSVAQILHPGDCKSLRTLVLGYGPTESAVQVSTRLISPQSEVGVISRPLPGNAIILVDGHGRVPRVGEIGEICIAGPIAFVNTLPASDSELAAWMARKRYADNTYNVGRAMRFQGADARRLFDSLRAVLEPFDIFYLTFEWDYAMGTLERRLHSDLQVSLDLEDENDDGLDALGTFWDTIAKDYQKAFDLENGPLASFRIIASGSGDCYLYYNIHHVLVDEWTCGMIIEAVRKQYRGIPWRETISPSWGSSMTRWENESRRDEALEAWKQRLSGVAALDTRSRSSCSAHTDSRGHASLSTVLEVSPKIVKELQRQIHGRLSPFVSLLSIFQVLLHKYTASRNLVVLIPVSRRGFDVRAPKTIGNMTYTAAIGSEVDFENDTFAAFGHRTESFVAFARKNSSVPVDKALGTISSTVREQSIMFVFSRAAVHDDVPGGVLPLAPAMFDLTVNVVERGDELSISAAYNSSRYDSSFREGLTGSYRQSLEQLSQKGIEHRLRDVVGPSTDMLVDLEWIANAAKPESPTQRGLLHEAFQAQSMQCPSSVAIGVIADGQRSLISYEELDARSTHLSVILQQDYGIGVGSIVPISIDQTADLLIAVIGILKSGAGYTPIPRDGSWPPERHRFCLWTSGTTGEPKGVMMSHAAALSCVSSISGRLYPRSVEDRVFQFFSSVFDVSVVHYFATLSLGATLCMMPRAGLLTDIRKAVGELKPTTASLTPSVAQLLYPRAAQLHTLILSGEVVPTKTMERFIRAGTTIINGLVLKPPLTDYQHLHRNELIKGYESGNLASPFVHGEICLGGRQLFSGYHGHNDATRSAYIHHEGYVKLYRTGDIGYINGDGDIVFCGRRDAQVKLHGQRLEPGTISGIIDEVTNVKGNAVEVVEERLVAFLVDEAARGSDAITARVLPHRQEDVERIRDYLQARVPSAFIPPVWVRISRLPLTTSGKLDVLRLAAVASDISAQDEHEHDFPENEHERLTHRCCVQVLGHPIGASTGILREAIPGFQLSFRQLMERPQVRKLAILLQQQSSSDKAGASGPRLSDSQAQIPARKAGPRRLPASSIQKRFCLAQDVFQDATYNVPGLFEHDIFRTNFEFVPSRGGYQQVVVEHLTVDASEYDLSALQGSESAANEMKRAILSDLELPFNTGAFPLFRCKIFKKPAGKTVIFFNFRHTLADEQSLRLLVSDLYCRVQSRVPQKLHLNIAQYGEFCAEEELTLIDETRMRGAMSFWREHLKGMEVIDLPMASNGTKGSDRPIPATFFKKVSLPKRVSSWTRGRSMTDFSAYLTYFQMALAASQTFSESAVLIPISQRRTRFGESYGCYLNTVSVRFAVEPTASLRTALGTCNRALLDVMDHSFVPYEAILDNTGLGADAFPVMFVYHEGNTRPTEVHDIGHVVRGVSGNIRPKFPLTFSLTVKPAEATHELEVSVDYDQSRVSATTVQSLCDRFPTLIDSAQEATEEAIIGQLAVLKDEEQGELGPQLAQTPEEPLVCAHDLVERRVRESPGSTAACFEGTINMTYQDLWRIATVIRDAAPRAVLVSVSQPGGSLQVLDEALRTSGVDAPVIPVHGRSQMELEGLEMPAVAPSDLAYVLYTSGSTGTPKGVQVEHGALSNSLAEHARIYGLGKRSRLLQLAPWTFDVSVVEILGSLSTGATLCLGSKDHLLSTMQESINAMKITHLATTPTLCALIRPETCPTLEVLAISGEPMTKTVQGIWSQAAKLLNVYGPSETTVNVTYCQVRPVGDVGIIGKPLRNVLIHILNDQLQEIPSGGVGQLAVGRAQIARGYTDKNLDQGSFVTHPRLGRLFLTGDLAHLTDDGSIRCRGRKDDQVKLRGQRIELEEVDRLVSTAAPAVQSTVASLVKTGQTEALCVAFSTQQPVHLGNVIQIQDPDDIDTQRLASRLEESLRLHLPRYAVPQYWVPTTGIPMHANGTLNRRLVRSAISDIPAAELDRFRIARQWPRYPHRPLASEMEQVLGSCFCEVLGVTDVSKTATSLPCPGTPSPPSGYVHTPAIAASACWLRSMQDLERIPSTWETVIQTHPSLHTRCLKVANHLDILEPSRKGTFSIRRTAFPSFSSLLAGIADVALGLDLAAGRVSSLGLFQTSDEAYCVFCAHHLAVGVVSWQIILDDLRRLVRGQEIWPESVTFEDWLRQLVQQPRCQAPARPGPDVVEDGRHPNLALAPHFPGVAHLNTVAMAKVASLEAPEEHASSLLSDASCTAGVEPVDLFLASLLLAFQRWKGIQHIEICVESHGRDLKNEALDVSRTVGWFTSMACVRFSLLTKHQTRIDELYADSDNDLFDSVDLGDAAVDEDPLNVRFALLDVGCSISNGRLGVNTIYSASVYKEEEARELLRLWYSCQTDTLQDLKRHDMTRRPLRRRRFPSLLLPQDQINALIHHGLEPFSIEQSMIQDIAPATDMQKSMVLASLEFGSYIESFTYRINGAFEINQFIRAWSAVIAKHAALRSRFIRSEVSTGPMRGEILQVILSPDLAPSILTQGSEAPTPLEFGFGEPTMRVHLYRTGDGAHWFNWDFHHTLINGCSIGIIMRDFESAYLGQPTSRVVSFDKVRSRLRELAEDREMLSFWKEELKATRPCRLADHSLPASSLPASSLRHHLASQDWRHDQTLSCPAARVQACAGAESVTVSTVLRAAWAMALSYFGGGGDGVIFGVTTSGRNLDVPGIEEIAGPCINTVPLRIRVDYQNSRQSFLQEAHSKSALLVRNDALSLHQIYRASGAKDVFDTIFVYQNHAKSRPDANLAFAMKLLKAVEKTSIPLNRLVSQDGSGHLHAASLVHGAHIPSAFLECLMTAFSLALTWLCDPEGDQEPRLVDLDLLSPETRQQVDEFGRGPPLGHSISTPWQLIAQQASRTLERRALEFYQGQRIEATSYGELIWRAENGAQYHHTKQGLGRGDKVAVFLDKSPDLILTMLSLFRLGAICVPLRHNDPDARLKGLLQEADPKLLILSRPDQVRFFSVWHLCHVEDMASWQPEDGGRPLGAEDPTAYEAALVLFTSGTSGLPKGVFMPSR